MRERVQLFSGLDFAEGFGKTSLREVKKKLTDLGLSLGMTFGEGGELAAAVMPDSAESDESRIPEQVGPLNG